MPPPQVDAAGFRQVMGHFATGVTVVTVARGENRQEPAGLAVSSFTSVSLDPLLVAVCVRNESSTWPLVTAAGTFGVNVLAHDQESVCRTFSQPGADRFAGLGWTPSTSGSPILDGALAFLECRIEAEYPGGDHRLVVAEVVDLAILREDGPLVVYRGGYGRFES